MDIRGVALKSTITGKLCQWVLTVIKWRRGLVPDINQKMMGEVEAWLHRRGVSIYTDLL
jgi:hypothetical protein